MSFGRELVPGCNYYIGCTRVAEPYALGGGWSRAWSVGGGRAVRFSSDADAEREERERVGGMAAARAPLGVVAVAVLVVGIVMPAAVAAASAAQAPAPAPTSDGKRETTSLPSSAITLRLHLDFTP